MAVTGAPMKNAPWGAFHCILDACPGGEGGRLPLINKVIVNQ